jgi:hypothetical protein
MSHEWTIEQGWKFHLLWAVTIDYAFKNQYCCKNNVFGSVLAFLGAF